jgi:hypothetical protein
VHIALHIHAIIVNLVISSIIPQNSENKKIEEEKPNNTNFHKSQIHQKALPLPLCLTTIT